MTNRVSLSSRDFSLLRLLARTPATAALLVRASPSFDGGAFTDERRLRERMQALQGAGLVRSFAAAAGGGGLQNYYKLTQAGFDALFGSEVERPPTAFFAAIAPAAFVHTMRLAEVVATLHRAAHSRGVAIDRFYRENELTLTVGPDVVQPDAFVRFDFAGKKFNIAIEIDGSTESVDSPAANAIRRKLQLYDAYQRQVLEQWQATGKTWERPRFRVVFLTVSAPRAYHVLALFDRLTEQPNRRLVLAATQSEFVGSDDPLMAPLLLDHGGRWQSLLDLHPTSPFERAPVRLPAAVATNSVVG